MYEGQGEIHTVFVGEAKRPVPVDAYIQKYEVEHPAVLEVLKEHPVLSYLLGKINSRGIVEDGSGMFGLKNPEDAVQWKGIFNHIVGASGNVYFLAERIAKATPSQKEHLVRLGYLPNSVRSLDPEKLRDHKLIDHAGRRQSDERKRYDCQDAAHPSTHSELNTRLLLHNAGADRFFLDHMKEEDHEYLISRMSGKRLRNIHYALLTYGDWTFDQAPVALSERFALLHARGRADKKTLDVLEQSGRQFEQDLTEVFGEGILSELKNRSPYPWERNIREAYAASAGLDADKLFGRHELG